MAGKYEIGCYSNVFSYFPKKIQFFGMDFGLENHFGFRRRTPVFERCIINSDETKIWASSALLFIVGFWIRRPDTQPNSGKNRSLIKEWLQSGRMNMLCRSWSARFLAVSRILKQWLSNRSENLLAIRGESNRYRSRHIALGYIIHDKTLGMIAIVIALFAQS